MKKTAFIAMAAITALTGVGTVSMTSEAAGSYPKGKVYIVNQNSPEWQKMKDQLEKWGVSADDILNSLCPDLPSTDVPDTEKPESPDTEVPDTEKPEIPDTDAPETPDTDVPEPEPPETPDTDVPETPDTDVPEKPETPDTNPPETEKPETPDSESSFAEQVVKLVNVERAKEGLSPLQIDDKVVKAAQVRAKEIEKSFAHTRPNGSSFSTALQEQGAVYRGAGENIAWGQRSPEQVMEGWMNSPGHRANILNANYKYIGVGHYQNSSGTNYWTQLFTY